MFPSFYDPNLVGTMFATRSAEAMAEGHALGIGHVRHSDGPKIALILVDPQVDFIHTNGALCVPGAVEDTRRTIEWIYRNMTNISQISASVDTHVPFQIFSPSWWIDQNGKHPGPFTPITLDDFHNKVFRPAFRNLSDVTEYYLTQLDASSGQRTKRGTKLDKKTLMIWPYHCLLGTPGYAIEPSLMEAIVYHSAARSLQPEFVIKGDIPKTEHYSILEPEVKVPDHPHGGLNLTFLNKLGDPKLYDLIYVAGQAKSHCDLETIFSILRYFDDQDAQDVIDRLRILVDCMSSVTGFEKSADDKFAEFQRDYGLRLVKSTDQIG